MNTATEYVVYMLGRSGDKKYDPAEFNYFNTFDKQGAKRRTLTEARIRTHELNSMSLGRATFGYERADDAPHVITEPTRDELVALLREALPLVNGSFEKPIAGQALAKRISAAINTPLPDVGENIGVYIDNTDED